MKRFLEMIEIAKRKPIFALDSDNVAKGLRTPQVDPTHFFELVEQCQPFVFALSDSTTDYLDILDDNGNTIYRDLDAPFKVFSIEMLGGDITVPSLEDISVDRSVYTHCIMAYEIEPKKYAYYVLGTIDHKGVKNTFVYSTRTMDVLVEGYVKRINFQEAGVESTREKIKFGTGKSKRFHMIRKIIHIRPKKDMIDHNPLSQRMIVWTQRWFVRGHWRAAATLGKDREGNYVVEGFTWVSEHVKGPEDVPLIQKVRVVDRQA